MGTLVGAWLSTQPGIRITLLGRSGRAASSPLVQTLYRSAAPVTMARCDVSCREEAATALAAAEAAALADGAAMRGVVHAGGVLADGLIADQTASRARTVWAPKVGCVKYPCHAIFMPTWSCPQEQLSLLSLPATGRSPGSAVVYTQTRMSAYRLSQAPSAHYGVSGGVPGFRMAPNLLASHLLVRPAALWTHVTRYQQGRSPGPHSVYRDWLPRAPCYNSRRRHRRLRRYVRASHAVSVCFTRALDYDTSHTMSSWTGYQR